jgi:hypothetical protein
LAGGAIWGGELQKLDIPGSKRKGSRKNRCEHGSLRGSFRSILLRRTSPDRILAIKRAHQAKHSACRTKAETQLAAKAKSGTFAAGADLRKKLQNLQGQLQFGEGRRVFGGLFSHFLIQSASFHLFSSAENR